MNTDTTAIQDMVLYLRQVRTENASERDLALKRALEKTTELISKEKEQIIEAYNQGYRDGESNINTPQNTQDISVFSDAE